MMTTVVMATAEQTTTIKNVDGTKKGKKDKKRGSRRSKATAPPEITKSGSYYRILNVFLMSVYDLKC